MSSMVEVCLSFSKMATLTNQSSMPSLKPHAQAHLLSATDKCKICDEPAARHVHYGATTCFSCRAFFRRSLQNKTSAKYVCRRHSMCDMNIKTRKKCQYCRYMKCLAVGMNPNYVLSEEERKRRFRKRNNSINEEGAPEEPHAVVSAAISIKTTEENLETEEMTEADKMTKSGGRNPHKTGYFNQVFQKHTEAEYNYSYAAGTISSPQMPPGFDLGLKQYRNSSQLKKNYFEQGFISQRELAWFQPPSLPLPVDHNQLRGNIIMRNETNISQNKCSASRDAVIERENTTSVIREARVKLFKEEERNTYFNTETKPLVQCNTISTISTYQRPENTSLDKRNEGMIATDTELDKIPEIDSSSDSEDEILLKIPMSQEPEIIFTEDEKHQLDKLVSDHDNIYHSVNFGEVLIKEMLMCSMFGVSMSTSSAIQGYRLQVERITKTANNLGCFTNLKKVDQVALLKENADLLVSLRGAIFFDKKKKGMDQLLSSMGIDDMDIIKKMFKPLIQTHSMNHIDYKVFNSIQDPANKKTEERNSFLQGEVADAILDNITTILLTYIILFSSDFCSLEDRTAVERTQHHYLRILERCIYSTSSRYRACSRMAHTLNAVTCVREMADIKKSRSIIYSVTAQIKT